MAYLRASEGVAGKAYDPVIARRLFGYLKPYTKELIVALALMTLGTLMALAGPYVVRWAIDEGLSQGNTDVVVQAALLYLFTNACDWGTMAARVNVMGRAGQSVIWRMRDQLFAHLQTMTMGFFNQAEVGRLISRVMSDVSVMRELITWAIVAVSRDLLMLGGIIVVMFGMNARLALLTFIVLPIMFVIAQVWRVRARESYRQVRAGIGAINAELQESIAGVRVVQSFAREELNYRRFAGEINQNNFEVNMDAAKLASLFFPSVDFMSAAAVALIVWVGGTAFLGEPLTPGVLVAFVLYIERFFMPIRDLTMRYNTFQATMAAGERIFNLLDTRPNIQDAPGAVEMPPIKGAVRYEDVCFGYLVSATEDQEDALPELRSKRDAGGPLDPEDLVLRHVNLDVAAGQTIAFVGPTGAGKSTMVRLLSRFYDVDSGRIAIDGIDVRDVTRQSLRAQMGIVLQEPFLFAGTVMDNIRYGRLEASDEEVTAAAQAVGAHEFIVNMPQGYDTEIEEGGANVSVGQRQLLSFARALLADPRILILDEATSSVDTQTERIIQEALARLLQGRTAFIIAHRLSTITRADKIVVIDGGEIIEEGTHQELLAQGGHYYRLYTRAYAEPLSALA
jgi:ATP-binding cassette subfamily B protein/subfamily B ATP-binding cassette protein MsbA